MIFSLVDVKKCTDIDTSYKSDSSRTAMTDCALTLRSQVSPFSDSLFLNTSIMNALNYKLKQKVRE